MTTPHTVPHHEKTFFGQPRALASIFGVEMWERFSFYGMQGILLLYLYYSVQQGGLAIPEGVAAGIVGAYGGSVYLCTIIGSWLADRLMGAERVLFYSAIVIVCGHAALALIHGVAGVVIGLMLVALGSGGVKASATSSVGSLYSAEDPRRDAGFSIFYLGINLGAFLGPLLTGLTQSTVGFHIGFGVAALGMAFGVTQYAISRRRMPAESRVVLNPLPAPQRFSYAVAVIIVVGAIAVAVITGLINYLNLANVVIGVTAGAAVLYFIVMLMSSRVTAAERRRVWAFVPLFLVSSLWWSLYQQQFTVVTIYSDQRLNRDLFGWDMPVAWIQSINPIFIIILSGVFAALWMRLGGRQPTTVVKFSMASVIMGAAFLLFLPFAGTGEHGTPVLAIVGILFVFTIAELLLSPVSLSVTTKLAPKAFHTQMIALLYLSWALGTAVSGALARVYQSGTEIPYFGILGCIAIAVGIVLLLIRKPVQKLMAPVH